MAGTPARSTTVTPTRLSPEGSDAALDLPRGCKLEVEWDGKEPRLLLRKGNKHQLQWPLEELTRIEVCHDASVGEPCLRFTLGSNVEHLQKPPSDPECLAAFNGGALRRGPKVFFLTSKDAKDVYAALCERKAAGLPCLADTQCCETSRGPPPLAGEDNVAALGLLSLAADPPASQRQQSVATSVASDASSSVPSVRETLIFVCSPKKGPLPSAKDEAIDVANETPAFIRRGGSPTDLKQELLHGRGAYKYFLFSGHGDVSLPALPPPDVTDGAGAEKDDEGWSACRQVTLGFTNATTGALELTLPSTLSEMLSCHGLQLVFLNGCETEPLAHNLRSKGVPHVVSWRTKAADPAARTLARTFFKAVGAGRTYAEAFADATQAVKAMTSKKGTPLYQLRDPDGAGGGVGPPWAAGVPVLLSQHQHDQVAGAVG